MDHPLPALAEDRPGPVSLRRPARQTAPLVFASPHSGRFYPPEFLAESRLDSLAVRRSEDSFVDELFAAAPDHGVPLAARITDPLAELGAKHGLSLPQPIS